MPEDDLTYSTNWLIDDYERKRNEAFEKPSSSMDRAARHTKMPIPPRIVIDVLAHRAKQRQAAIEGEARVKNGTGNGTEDATARSCEAKHVCFEPEV